MAKEHKENNETADSKELNEEVDDEIKNEEEEEEESIEDVSFEEIMKNPEKYSEEGDIIESTEWCPQCIDNTIFAKVGKDKVCTVCGYTKSHKELEEDSEDDEFSEGFELVPEEDLEGLGISLGDDVYDDKEDRYA